MDAHEGTSANWLDGSPQITTSEHLSLPWNGRRDGYWFRCGFCGHRFKVGDAWRFFYGNNFVGGRNVFVCASCDGADEVLETRWLSLSAEWDTIRRGKFWRFAAELRDAK